MEKKRKRIPFANSVNGKKSKKKSPWEASNTNFFKKRGLVDDKTKS